MLSRARILGLALIAVLITAGASFAQSEPLKPVHEALIATPPETPDGHLAVILRRKKLVVGVKADYRPWGYRESDGSLQGLEVDLARELADRLGVALELTSVTASNRIDRVNQKRVDVVIATTGDTAERRVQTDMIQPNYYSSGVVVYGRRDLGVSDWTDLEGEKICLNRNAYYNRALEEEQRIDGEYFSGRREALLALKYGRCVGWAFDDTALLQYERSQGAEQAKAFGVLVEPKHEIPWAILVPKGEGARTLGRFLSDLVGEWHASGRILQLQDHWGIDRSRYVEDQHALWRREVSGTPLCARDPQTGARADECLNLAPYQSAQDVTLTPWMAWVKEKTGLNLGVFNSDFERNRLLRGLGLTLALSSVAILGALAVGISLATLEGILRGWGLLGRILMVPQTILVTVARMTPPILQLYIVFFGLGGMFLASPELSPGAFVIACVIFSLYAGASNAVMLSHGMEQEREAYPKKRAMALLPGAIARSFDGLVSACVNIVKAAGMASAIAVGEIVSSVNLVVAEGGDAKTLMNGLLVFYFVLVTLVIWLFRRARTRVVGA